MNSTHNHGSGNDNNRASTRTSSTRNTSGSNNGSGRNAGNNLNCNNDIINNTIIRNNDGGGTRMNNMCNTSRISNQYNNRNMNASDAMHLDGHMREPLDEARTALHELHIGLRAHGFASP